MYVIKYKANKGIVVVVVVVVPWHAQKMCAVTIVGTVLNL